MYFIFSSDGGAPKRRGARGNLPPFSMGLLVIEVLVVRTAKPQLRLSGPDRRQPNGLVV